jgi:prolipoprotein diacylglyceryltransferase
VTPLAFIPPPPIDGVHIGPLFLHLYGLCIAIGVLAAFWLANRRWVQAGGKPGELERPAIWAVAAGFLGARIAYVSTHTDKFHGKWWEVLFIWQGGLALDAAIPAIPLAQAFGRWGNYFNQELFGTPTTLPWALEVERNFRPPQYREFETFHPTFLYESLYNLVVVAILLRVGARWRLRPGSLALVYLVLYGAGRFLLELLRTDTTYRLFGLSRNAYVSLAVVVGGSVLLALRERRRPSTAALAPSEEAGPEAAGSEVDDTVAAAPDEKDEDQAREEAPARGRDEGGGRSGP